MPKCGLHRMDLNVFSIVMTQEMCAHFLSCWSGLIPLDDLVICKHMVWRCQNIEMLNQMLSIHCNKKYLTASMQEPQYSQINFYAILCWFSKAREWDWHLFIVSKNEFSGEKSNTFFPIMYDTAARHLWNDTLKCIESADKLNQNGSWIYQAPPPTPPPPPPHQLHPHPHPTSLASIT